MTRFVVDAGTMLELAGTGTEVASEHELLAPTLLRSQTLSLLHEAVQRGELPADVARERLARIGRMPIRLLGDAVLRRRAWEVADQLGWASTYDAEYDPVTAAPTASTSPANSSPRIFRFGRWSPVKKRERKTSALRNPQSVLVTVEAWILTRTSSAPGAGRSTSSTRRTSGGPYLS